MSRSSIRQLIVLSEEAGNAAVTINGSGDVLAGNNQNDTLTAAGVAGSISGGTGTNLFLDLGANDTISAQGQSDTIFGGPGSATIQLLGASIFGNGTIVTDAAASARRNATSWLVAERPSYRHAMLARATRSRGGSHTTLGSPWHVTLSGSAASVVGGLWPSVRHGQRHQRYDHCGRLWLHVRHRGDQCGICARRGGAAELCRRGGHSTIMGGSGNATVFGGTGATSLFGGAGGEVTYVNTTAGGLRYFAGSGNETIDASLSKRCQHHIRRID